jgi:Ig-like domain CHU_C associated
LNFNGGNSIAGSYNQKHRVTIVGKTVCPTVNVSFSRPITFCTGDSTVFTANADPSYTYQWYRNNTLISGETNPQLIVKQSGSYFIEITGGGCTLPSTSFNVTANFGVPAPVTVSRTITSGTVITAGNGLQANGLCAGQTVATYAGPTIGYDGNNQTAPDPQVTIAGAGTNLGKVKVSIKWRKIDGADHNSCGSAGAGNPYNSEVSFQIVSPTNTTINLLNSNTYADGGTSAGLLTTVFEDGAAIPSTVPVSGTFAPIQGLSLLNGINPNGDWKLIARDSGNQDPLCVESFSVTVYTIGTGGASTITWYSSTTGGSALGTGSEYIPSDTAPGTYSYYAEAGCADPNLVCTKSIRKAATLTITGLCVTVGGVVTTDANVCSGNNSGTLSLNGHTGNVLRWESSTNDFVNITQIANTTTSLNYTNLTQTTKFRAVLQNGSCLVANSSSAIITVTTISATASNMGPYFIGQIIQLSATGGSTYNWTGPNSFTSTSNPVNISNASLAMAGIYTATVTQNSCSATATTLVIVTDNNPCSLVVEYDYVQAGNPFIYKFPLVNNMVIAEVPEETSILVNPICPNVPIESFKMKIQGLPYLHEVIENIYFYALFNNTGADILGRHLLPGNYSLTITGYDQNDALGNITYGPIVTNFTIVSNTTTISAPSFTINSLCAGSSFNVNFTTSGIFSPNNQFEVQLSDANGAFDNPIIIGSSLSAGVVLCTLPMNISMGSTYKIRVVSTNQTFTGNTNTLNLNTPPTSLNLLSPTNDINGGTNTLNATQSITATNKILSPANVIYKAGNAILLNAGFQVNASSVFKAEIGGCN